MINRVVKVLFFAIIVKPVVLIVLGLNIKWKNKLPQEGPAMIIANHNSHLDTLVLMSLYPVSKIHKIRPVAAADYFFNRGKFISWFVINCIGIIPLDRTGNTQVDELFSTCHEALDNGDILILFPEGSRGKPEVFKRAKKGIHYMLKGREKTKIVPVMLHGLGRALPKGEALLVPFNCDVVVGDPIELTEKPLPFINEISEAFEQLSEHCLTLPKDTN